MTDNNNNGVFITIPSTVGVNKDSIRPWEFVDDNTGEVKKMAEITLPKGTEINGVDVSYYKFSVSEGRVDPGGQKYLNTHSVLLPETNNENEPWIVTVKRDFGFEKDGEWQPDIKEVKCDSLTLKDSARKQYESQKEYRKEQSQKKTSDINNDKEIPSLDDVAKESKDASKGLSGIVNKAKDHLR